MKTKQFLPILILVALIFLTSCGESQAVDGLNSNDGQIRSGDLTSELEDGLLAEEASSNYWDDWVKDMPSGSFEKAGSENFVFEEDGYIMELTLDKWAATRGSSEYVLHPASNRIPLPLLKPSDCVIPFVLKAKTATEDTAFTTDFRLLARVSRYGAYYCELSRFEETVETNAKMIDDEKNLNSGIDDFTSYNGRNLIHERMLSVHSSAWGSHFENDYSETKRGDEQVIIGCYVINDYYSPKFPDGNLESFPSGSAVVSVRVMMNNNAQSLEEIAVVMQ